MRHIKWSIFLLALMFSGAVFGAADEEVVASVDYFYAQDGTLIGRAVNGVRVNYEYDKRGQLLAVKDADGKGYCSIWPSVCNVVCVDSTCKDSNQTLG